MQSTSHTIVIVTIEEHCNLASGFPCWMINYYSDKAKLDDRGWNGVRRLLERKLSGEVLDREKLQHLSYAKFDDAERYAQIEERLKNG